MSASPSSAPFPPLSRAYICAFQFSSWYPLYASQTIKSTIVRPLSDAFRSYLEADGVFVPDGAEDMPATSTLSDDEKSDDEDKNEEPTQHYSFPELDANIRTCIREYGGVFPKLNFSAPKDAAWLLPASSPLKCTSPADVYLLLKSSDFVTHDLSAATVFAECEDGGGADETSASTTHGTERGAAAELELELVLRKWYPVDRARELRCFVRSDRLIAISQRDTNFYDFWADVSTRTRVARAVLEYWDKEVRPRWPAQTQPDYILDLLLTRDLSRAHIIDFNPFHPKTDSLLFTYEELAELHCQPMRGVAPSTSTKAATNGDTPAQNQVLDKTITEDENIFPLFRVIDSASHPAANRNAPAHQHNMIPFEAATMSSGHDIEQFAAMWNDSVSKASMNASSSDSDSDN